MVLRSWGPTMQLKVDIGPCRQIVEFSAVELSFFYRCGGG